MLSVNCQNETWSFQLSRATLLRLCHMCMWLSLKCDILNGTFCFSPSVRPLGESTHVPNCHLFFSSWVLFCIALHGFDNSYDLMVFRWNLVKEQKTKGFCHLVGWKQGNASLRCINLRFCSPIHPFIYPNLSALWTPLEQHYLTFFAGLGLNMLFGASAETNAVFLLGFNINPNIDKR